MRGRKVLLKPHPSITDLCLSKIVDPLVHQAKPDKNIEDYQFKKETQGLQCILLKFIRFDKQNLTLAQRKGRETTRSEREREKARQLDCVKEA